jgi:ZIP family zinc transporter
MNVIFFAVFAFISTLLGGLAAIRFKNYLHLILGFTAGVILGLVSFDILPEIFDLVVKTSANAKVPMIALVVGFMVFHISEKFLLVHEGQEEKYGHHHHPTKGVYSALALITHSFIDGIGVGLAFQVSAAVGTLVSIAVIGHAFADGLNTASLMLINKNTVKKTLGFIALNALAPLAGAISTLFFQLPENLLVIYLGFFAGFLLYIGLEEILPEAHSKSSSLQPIVMTILGLIFIYGVTAVL